MIWKKGYFSVEIYRVFVPDLRFSKVAQMVDLGNFPTVPIQTNPKLSIGRSITPLHNVSLVFILDRWFVIYIERKDHFLQ